MFLDQGIATCVRRDDYGRSNATLIVEAVNVLPSLLAEVERLRRLVAEDDEDTVRVPREELETLRRQIAAVRSLAELDRKDVFLAPGSKIKRVQEDRRRDLGAIVTTSMITVDDVREALDGTR